MTAFDQAWTLLKDFYFNPDGIVGGGKGPTSKDGKLTPKGAALKRWNC